MKDCPIHILYPLPIFLAIISTLILDSLHTHYYNVHIVTDTC